MGFRLGFGGGCAPCCGTDGPCILVTGSGWEEKPLDPTTATKADLRATADLWAMREGYSFGQRYSSDSSIQLPVYGWNTLSTTVPTPLRIERVARTGDATNWWAQLEVSFNSKAVYVDGVNYGGPKCVFYKMFGPDPSQANFFDWVATQTFTPSELEPSECTNLDMIQSVGSVTLSKAPARTLPLIDEIAAFDTIVVEEEIELVGSKDGTLEITFSKWAPFLDAYNVPPPTIRYSGLTQKKRHVLKRTTLNNVTGVLDQVVYKKELPDTTGGGQPDYLLQVHVDRNYNYREPDCCRWPEFRSYGNISAYVSVDSLPQDIKDQLPIIQWELVNAGDYPTHPGLVPPPELTGTQGYYWNSDVPTYGYCRFWFVGDSLSSNTSDLRYGGQATSPNGDQYRPTHGPDTQRYDLQRSAIHYHQGVIDGTEGGDSLNLPLPIIHFGHGGPTGEQWIGHRESNKFELAPRNKGPHFPSGLLFKRYPNANFTQAIHPYFGGTDAAPSYSTQPVIRFIRRIVDAYNEADRLPRTSADEIQPADDVAFGDVEDDTPGLGDRVAGMLAAVGITEERVSRLVGRDCGCKGRREALNRWSHAREDKDV